MAVIFWRQDFSFLGGNNVNGDSKLGGNYGA